MTAPAVVPLDGPDDLSCSLLAPWAVPACAGELLGGRGDAGMADCSVYDSSVRQPEKED